MNDELKTNSRGFLTNRKHNFSLPNDFPCLGTLKNYARPVTSGERASPMRDKGELDLAALASLCEDYFEWATVDGILNRFRALVWKVAIMHVFRRSALEADRQQQEGPSGSNPVSAIGSPASFIKAHLGPQKKKKTDKNARLDALSDVFVNQGTAPAEDATRRYDPSVPDTHPLVKCITLSRCHTSTDGLREYRLQYSPIQFVTLTRSGIRKFRPQPETKREPKEAPDPNTNDILWVSEIVLSKVHPELVTAYLTKEAEKGRKKPGKPRKKDRDCSLGDFDDERNMNEPPQASSSQSRLLSQLDAMAASSSKGSQTKPRRTMHARQPPSSPAHPRELPLSPIRSQQFSSSPAQARNREMSPVLSRPRPSSGPNFRGQFLFTFVDPGTHYDDEKDVNDDSDDSLPPTPPATQESLFRSQPHDFSAERSPVRATARVTAILDSIIDREWGRSKGKGKRKAGATAAATERPAKKTKASHVVTAAYLPATPLSSQPTQPIASSRAKGQRGDDSSEIEMLSPQATAGQRTQTHPIDKHQESRVPESVGRGTIGLHHLYGVALPDLDDSDDSDLDLNLPPPRSQTSSQCAPLALNDIIDLT